MGLRVTPFRKSASRQTLFMGCDREMILCCIGFWGGIAILPFTFSSVCVGVAGWAVCFVSLRMMAQSDPQKRKVYLRYIRHWGRPYYPARSTPFNTPSISLKR